MQSSVEIEDRALSDLKVWEGVQALRPAEKLRQIIVPVDLTNDCRRALTMRLILSTHNGKWLEHMLFGRHADRILANAPRPVLVVREQETDFIG